MASPDGIKGMFNNTGNLGEAPALLIYTVFTNTRTHP
jgi:hypothetical protein